MCLCPVVLSGSRKNSLPSLEDVVFLELKVRALSGGGFKKKEMSQIRGFGYRVESLEATLWCFEHTDTFVDAVLMAANLGDDADTTAVITGQLASACYGASAIPSE